MEDREPNRAALKAGAIGGAFFDTLAHIAKEFTKDTVVGHLADDFSTGWNYGRMTCQLKRNEKLKAAGEGTWDTPDHQAVEYQPTVVRRRPNMGSRPAEC